MYLGNGPRADGCLVTRTEDKGSPFPLAILFLSLWKPLCLPRAGSRGDHPPHHSSFTRKGDEDGAEAGQFYPVVAPMR